jgi:CBS domain-containing protein
MKARNLASPRDTVGRDDPASEAARILARHDVRAVLVVDSDGGFVDALSDSELLRALLPSYVEDDESLARVLEESASEVLFQRLEGRTVGDLVPADREADPVVNGEDTLVESASAMVRSRASMVGVVDDGRLIGGISIDDLLTHLLGRR